MNVIVDTCVWSRALRRRNPEPALAERLAELITEGRVVMLGPIRQELLSGVAEKKQFQKLRSRLSAFHDFALQTEHYETAAMYDNTCRCQGIQGAHTDYLLCAVAVLEKMALYTVDKDFQRYGEHLALRFYS